MKQKKLLRVLLTAVMFAGMAAMAGSCSDDKTQSSGPVERGPVTGVVLDDLGAPLAGVAVTVSDVELTTITGVSGTATTDAEGKYSIGNVPVTTHIVSFTKKDYQSVDITITAGNFNAEKTAQVDARMVYAAAKITGTVTDAKNNSAPLPGVTVSISDTQKATTDADGKFLFENLVLESYTVTFTLKDYTTVTRKITTDDFADGILATLDVEMGGKELLPGMTATDLKKTDIWYYNEYRGGKGNGGGKVDWSVVYMSTLNFWGAWENQNEGCTLQIRNSGDEQKNPASTDVFDSFVYGRKVITDDNKIMTLMVRTHNASDDAPAYFGVQVIDLTADEPENRKLSDLTHASGDYKDYDFDLSEYIGKEVVIAIGIYRQQTGDYWKQVVLRHISFAADKNSGDDYLPGTEVPRLEGWHMTQGMVRSTLPNPNRTFTGITPSGMDVSKDNRNGYNAWREIGHIGAEWAFMYVNKDVEPTPGEGFIIKTRGDAPQSTTLPESYFYAKFAIAEGCNHLTFRTRTFEKDNPTYFKMTAIDEDGNVTFLQPVSHKADMAEAAADGCWKFKNNKGGTGNPDDYATFEYDLSQFNGRNVMLAIGVFKGDAVGGEQKLCFYSLDFN